MALASHGGSPLGAMLGMTFLELGKPPENSPARVRPWMAFFLGQDIGGAPNYIHEAFAIIASKNLTPEEARMLDTVDMARQDRIGQLAWAKDEGRLEVARAALLEGLEPSLVAKIAGLSEDEIAAMLSDIGSQD